MFGRSHCSRRGFSLVEIVVVMAVLAVLFAIILRTQDGVKERALISRAEAELTLLSMLLEKYKSTWGEYPMVPTGEEGSDVLWNALSGQRLPDGSPVLTPAGKQWLGDLAGFQFADGNDQRIDELPPPGALAGQTIRIIDPWNQPYHYHYRSGPNANTWQRTGFVLLSLGPSGGEALENGRTEASGVPPSGLLPETYPKDNDTFDNILAP